MGEQRDEQRPREVRAVLLDFIPLGRAAAMVHERLFPGQGSMDSKTLDVIALALSSLLPLYQREMETGALQAVPQADVAAGRFTRGATTLEFPNRPALRHLVVSREQTTHAAETIARDSVTAARVRLTMRQSPRSAAG